MADRRVVITGVGAITPIGIGGAAMWDGLRSRRSAVQPITRFDPARLLKGEPPLHLDYAAPKAKVGDYMRNESRFRMIERADPERYKKFVQDSEEAARRRFLVYQQLAGISVPPAEPSNGDAPPPAAAATNAVPKPKEGA